MSLEWVPCSVINASNAPKALEKKKKREDGSYTVSDLGVAYSTAHKCSVCSSPLLMDRVRCGLNSTCAEHSTEKAYFGLTEYAHKTAGYLVMTKDGGDSEAARKMKRAFKRSR